VFEILGSTTIDDDSGTDAGATTTGCNGPASIDGADAAEASTGTAVCGSSGTVVTVDGTAVDGTATAGPGVDDNKIKSNCSADGV